MAEGGEFAMDQPYLDDAIDHDDDDDDDVQEANRTQPFQPGTASTPHGGEQHELQTMQHEQRGLPDTSYDQIPSFEGFIHEEDKPTVLENARGFIKKLFPKVDFGKLGPIGFSKKPGNDTTIVSFGTRGGETEIFRKDGKGLLQKFKDKFKTSLGAEAESLIAQDNDEIRENRQKLREAEKQLRDAEKLASQREKAAQEVQDLRIRIERTQANIEKIQEEQGTNVESGTELRELQQRIKNYKTDLENAKKEVAALEKQAKTKAKEQKSVDQLRAKIAAKESERNIMEARLNDTRTLDELKEQEAELQRQNQEDQAVIDDENTSPSDK